MENISSGRKVCFQSKYFVRTKYFYFFLYFVCREIVFHGLLWTDCLRLQNVYTCPIKKSKPLGIIQLYCERYRTTDPKETILTPSDTLNHWVKLSAQWAEWLWNRRVEHWAIRSSARSSARTAHTFALRCGHSFARSLSHSRPSSWKKGLYLWNKCVDFISFQPTVRSCSH